MSCNYYHILIARNRIEMSCIIGNFDNQIDYERALKVNWDFEMKKVTITNITQECCFVRLSIEHRNNVQRTQLNPIQ